MVASLFYNVLYGINFWPLSVRKIVAVGIYSVVRVDSNVKRKRNNDIAYLTAGNYFSNAVILNPSF